MAWIARNLDGTILIFNRKPSRCSRYNIKIKKRWLSGIKDDGIGNDGRLH